MEGAIFSREYFECSCKPVDGVSKCSDWDKKLCNPSINDYKITEAKIKGIVREAMLDAVGSCGGITESDIGQNFDEDYNKCQCGCGVIIPKKTRWVRGHHTKVRKEEGRHERNNS